MASIDDACQDSLSLVNFPANTGNYKFVQIEIRGVPHMVFGEYSQSYHCDLLERILAEQGITDPPRTHARATGEPIIALRGSDYSVEGMGSAHISTHRRTVKIQFYMSADYGIGPSSEYRVMLEAVLPDWVIDNGGLG